MNKIDYTEKLKELISDNTKFEKCIKSQSEKIKKSINEIAKPFKDNNKFLYYKFRRKGHYNNGHLYGLPKVHKNTENPPLRPIISMTGTVTHDIAQFLNNVIRPYLNTTYVLKSADEFLLDTSQMKLNPSDRIVSLDVESLFTNVPVIETIQIILRQVYHHPSKAAPEIPQIVMEKLLTICTTSTPFDFNNQTYIQKEGVSMGSPLGPTFADFYMSDLENKLLHENRKSNPTYYKRYVDDIFAIFKNDRHINLFKSRMTRHSVLRFTHEEMKNNRFNFLDVNITVTPDLSIETSVYIKPTDKGNYMNYASCTPDNYKKSIIKTLVHRAIKYSSNWELVHQEIERIKQVLSNNNFPQAIVENTIRNVLNQHHDQQPTPKRSTVDFFIEMQSLPTLRNDRKVVKKIISEHVKSTDESSSIQVHTFYKPYKLSSHFSTRPHSNPLNRSSVVYRFECPEVSCNATYIGMTTCKLLKRCKQHRYKESSIFKHFTIDHDIPPPSPNSIPDSFSIIQSYNNKIDLKIAEALFIKDENPIINIKYNECSQFFNVFR